MKWLEDVLFWFGMIIGFGSPIVGFVVTIRKSSPMRWYEFAAYCVTGGVAIAVALAIRYG